MDHHTALLFGRIFGAAIAVLIGALVVQFVTSKLAGFRPPYGTAALASLLGYLASYAIGFVVAFAVTSNKVEITGSITVVTLVFGFFAQAAIYSFMIKSHKGKPLGFGRACIVSIVQVVVAGLIIGAMMFMTIGTGP